MTYGYWSDLPGDGYEWVFRPNACSGAIPTNGGQVCVFASAAPERIDRGGVAVIGQIVSEGAPDLADRLRAATPPPGTRTWSGHHGYIRRSHGPGWALVGDAGYFKDPISAHGLTDALRDAELLALAVIEGHGDASHLDGSLEQFQATRDRLSVPLFDVVDRIASQQWNDARDRRSAAAAQLGHDRRGRDAVSAGSGARLMSRRTLMGVWAHPDDEAYLSAGLMAEFRRRGDRVVVVTATLGERGTNDPVAWPPERMAALRRRELRASLAALGVDEHHLLGFADGECHLQDGTDAVARLVDDIEPDLIVTFGPDGMTGHTDHRAVSRWTTEAWAHHPARRRPVVRHPHHRLPRAVGSDQPAHRAVGRPTRATVHPSVRRRPQRSVARRPAGPEGRRAASTRLADRPADRPGRPGHVPRVVANRIVPQCRSRRSQQSNPLRTRSIVMTSMLADSHGCPAALVEGGRAGRVLADGVLPSDRRPCRRREAVASLRKTRSGGGRRSTGCARRAHSDVRSTLESMS